MRRMNYNPFEKPFASGEYNPAKKRFLLDKPLTEGFYLLVIYEFGDDEYLNAIITITSSNVITSTSSQTFSSFYQDEICFSVTPSYKNEIEVRYQNSSNEYVGEGSTISVYKIA